MLFFIPSKTTEYFGEKKPTQIKNPTTISPAIDKGG